MPPEYIPGRCNIGPQGRAIRVGYGLILLAAFIALDLLILGSVSALYRLVFVIPFYFGFLGVLMGTMSFCVMTSSRGTYDLIGFGLPFGKSSTRMRAEDPEWRKKDRAKANAMQLEALAAGSFWL